MLKNITKSWRSFINLLLKQIDIISNKIKDLLLFVYKKGFFHLLGANVLIQIAGFASQFFVSWLLKPEELGLIKTLQTYINLASIAASGGFNASVLKLCSENRELPEKKVIYTLARKYILIFSFCTFLIMNLLVYIDIVPLNQEFFSQFFIYSISLFAISLNSLQNVFLQALKKISEMSKALVKSKIIMILLIIIITYFFKVNGFIIATLIGSYFTLYILMKKVKSCIATINIKDKIVIPFNTQWFYAKYSLLSNFLYTLFLSLDIIILNKMQVSKLDIGYYSFALLVIVPFEVFRGTIIQIITPYFSEKGDNKNELFKQFKKYTKLNIKVVFIITFLSIIIIPKAQNIIFNYKYDNSNQYIIVLLLAWFVRNLYTVAAIALFGLGKIHYNFYPLLFLIPLLLFLNITLVNYLGPIGVAYGLFFTEIMAALISFALFIKLKRSAYELHT